MTDLVVISLEAWDDVWRRNQHLVARLLEGDPSLRVLFVEPPADPLHDLVSRRTPAGGFDPTPAPGFEGRLLRFRAVKALPRRIDRRVDERLARAVERAAATAGMRHPLLWVNDPDGAAVARLTGGPTLYDITDDWAAADRPAAEIARIRDDEAWLLSHAGAVVACSPELVRRKSGGRPGSITLIPNAVDVEAYRAPRPRPADLPPRAAVYVGTLHTDRLDLEVCEATARALGADGRLVLVGPNALDDTATQRLREAGALLLGPRSRDDVIGYLQHAEVLVVPHVVTPFTESLDPIKLYEYTAVGRPVIATPVAGFRDAADADVRVVAASDFPGAVAAALAQPTPPAGRTKAPVASWDERAAAMRAVIDGLAGA
jgi:glycosyltransferase involved in cell wall biosynthesis